MSLASIIPRFLKDMIHSSFIYRKHINRKRLDRIRKYVIPENEVKAAAENESTKDEFVKKYSSIWPDRTDKFLESARICLNKSNHTLEENIKREMLFCYFAYGFPADEFICYSLINKSATERELYVSDRELMSIVYMLNDYIDMTIYNNKARTYELFKEYYGRQAIAVNKGTDFGAFDRFVRNRKEVVIKPVREAMGRGIRLIETGEICKDCRTYFDELLQSGEYLIEERLFQSRLMAEYNDSSVNTIRIITFNTRHGIIAPFAFLKTGRCGSFVDNGGAGGILIGIDKESGVTNTHGVDEAGNIYKSHPDTGKPFMGFQLPDYEQAVELCKKLSAMTPRVRFVGWDLAYTDTGWVIVEGNGMSQLVGPQSTQQRGVKQQVYDIMKDMVLIVRGKV